jgi:hypothetical protein
MTSLPRLRLLDRLSEKQEKVFSVSLCLCGEVLFDREAAL